MIISRPETFVPIAQEFASWPNLVSETLYVRSRIPPSEAAPVINAAIHSIAADMPFVGVQPLSDVADAETRLHRLGAMILGLFGTLSVLLVAVGVYGVLAFSVRQRISEIGIRMALGATPNAVLRMLLRDGLRIVSIGAVAGIAAAFALTRFIQSQLYRITASDLTTFLLATLLVAIAAVVACLIPAVGAARMNPTVALRHD